MNINDAGLLVEATAMDSIAHSGPFSEPPSLLVLHYTASGPGALNDATHFARRTKKGASAHLIVGREGELFQSVSMNWIAHHAGRSMWRGRTGCNRFSLGIEIDNWGPLTFVGDQYKAWPGTVVNESLVISARHKNGGDNDAWEMYPEHQLLVLDDVVECILDKYPSIVDIAGHDDIAPMRKEDPGPAFRMKRYTDLLSKTSDDDPIKREVWANALNVRTEPNSRAEKFDWGPLPKGTPVDVLVDAGDWSYVEVRSFKDGQPETMQGWVFDKYLR